MRPVADAREIESIQDVLADHREASGIRVRGLVGEHPAYARILHPAHKRNGEGSLRQVTWQEIATTNDVRLDPTTPFRRLTVRSGMAAPRGEPGAWDPELVPSDGSLPRQETSAISRNLSRFGSADCWFVIWNGMRGIQADPDQQLVTWMGNPHVVYRGDLRDLADFDWTGTWQSPHLWFDNSRTWCVASPLDGFDTFVGGPSTLIQSVRDDPVLEALAIGGDELATKREDWTD